MNADVRSVQLTEISPPLTALKPRKDAFNNPILKGNNSHKVIFRDQANNGPLFEIHIVENFKEYNLEEPQMNKKTQICDCTII
ncbi:unnamed protein product (macronuclear) [Paramecium tetraurelia]|uniref:Uncharacterized protein n=1 Tax=Paramecium tetraurelia TaxID=5888 RepID=A0DZN3_PARTE|nr:uncharacterized protein GSPATT00021668001 [Paramecium tetraurelia]CAK88500.1 unnamed protein product [Paramecium tetraurelia]|eukprot:XP_001455897.1 hypothetical protein (macronuclear) [Paramecium tetraurelia strain d4-2]